MKVRWSGADLVYSADIAAEHWTGHAIMLECVPGAVQQDNY